MLWNEFKERKNFILSNEIEKILTNAPDVKIAKTIDDLYTLAHTEEAEALYILI